MHSATFSPSELCCSSRSQWPRFAKSSAYFSVIWFGLAAILDQVDNFLLLETFSDNVSPLLKNHSVLRVKPKLLFITCRPTYRPLRYLPLSCSLYRCLSHPYYTLSSSHSTTFFRYSKHTSNSGPLHLHFSLPVKLFFQHSFLLNFFKSLLKSHLLGRVGGSVS